MGKQFFVRKILLSSFVFICFFSKAQIPEDSLVMKIGNKEVSLAEFEFIARKNNGVDFSDKKSLEEYVELFKNFKLKVLEAEDMGLDKTSSFLEELETYKSQLKAGYLSDKKAEEAAAKIIYERGNEYLVVSQIVFPLEGECLPKDTVGAYQQAIQVYDRIQAGENFDQIGQELHHAYLHHTHSHNHDENCEHTHEHDENCIHAIYEYIPCLLPLERTRVLEEAAYSLQAGEVSKPVRTMSGYHLIFLKDRKPNFGQIRVSHLLIPFEKDTVSRTKAEALLLAEEIYNKVMKGEDLLSLIEVYAFDKEMGNGLLPPVNPGELITEMEDAILSLTTPGEVSEPFLTAHGYHIVQLIEKNGRAPFEKEKTGIITAMGRDDRNFELFRAFDERLKKECNYVFYAEAYAELEKLYEEYFPSSREFYEKAKSMKKTLLRINNEDIPQSEFAYYMHAYPFSVKTYAGDFMKEIYDLFVRDIMTTSEKQNLLSKYPEIPYLIQEYHDGILLFEISNKKIWNEPIEEQADLEKQWIAELSQKYPVTINRKLLKKLKK